MSDLAARIKDLTERIDSVNAEIHSVHEDGDTFQKLIEPDLERRRVELKRELADLQGQVPATSPDTSLDYPDFLIPDPPASGAPLPLGVHDFPAFPPAESIEVAPLPSTATAPTADRPRTQEKPGTGAKDPQPERPPREERPRTQEKPGTGAKDPEPEKPVQEHTGPTGQVTDEAGTYGPEQTWKPGTRDWNKVNRIGGTAKRVPKVVYALGIVALLALLIGTLARPSASPAPAAAAATAQSATTQPASTTGALVATYSVGPLIVERRPNSTITSYRLNYVILPDQSVKMALEAPCGDLAQANTIAQVSWSFDQNRKTCPPGPQGPYPGTVTVTYTTPGGKVFTWKAGSESGTFGEAQSFQ